jgi:glycine cleavage system H lipoate-binding protein
MPQVHDKEGKPIKQGETVAGKIRGGKHAGEVQAVITDEKEAKDKGVKNPPKVVIEDQHGNNW